MWCCSSSISCWVEHACLALCNRELMMLYLFAMAWWLSHCKYWLVWVGFLYTVVARLPSLWGVTKMSKKGIDPSALVVSAVNLMFGSSEFMWWKNSSLCCSSRMTKVSSTYLFHRLGGVELCLRHLFQTSPEDVGHFGTEWTSHGCTFHLLIILPLGHKAGTLQAEFQ